MSSYTGNPGSSPRDLLRFNSGDTGPQSFLLTDGEVDYLNSQYPGSPWGAALAAVDAMIAKNGQLYDQTVGPVSLHQSSVAANLMKTRSIILRRLATSGDCSVYAGGISSSDKIANASGDAVSPFFTRSGLDPDAFDDSDAEDYSGTGDNADEGEL